MKKDKELIELAKMEAKNLKEHCTNEELSNLNFHHLNPDTKQKCIYGQMTGHCNSDRASYLILKCATKVLVQSPDIKTIYNPMTEFVLNGEPKTARTSFLQYISPIEAVIVRYPKYNKKLIDFLKGDSNDFLKIK